MGLNILLSGIRHISARWTLSLFVVISFIIPSGFAQGVEEDDPYSATLVAFEGEVSIQKQDEEIWLPVEVNIPLEEGDRIKTGKDSQVEILMDDGSMVKLEENSEITIRELAADYQTRSITSSLFLWFGRVLSNVTKFTSKNSRFRISTPTLVAGVRGTEFIVETTDSQLTEVGVFDGEVTVGGLDKEGRLIKESEVVLNKGFQTSVKKGKRPKAPFGFSRRMLAHQKKLDRLRKKALKQRRDLPQIMKKRVKAQEQASRKWKKIKLEKQEKRPKKKDLEKRPSPEKNKLHKPKERDLKKSKHGPERQQQKNMNKKKNYEHKANQREKDKKPKDKQKKKK
ncbi:MAG: FecR domain-containing protein [Deltaproteobacteria bacterium]|nr:FecR domain-containing protein [Deltaproteobacteria bacterium]